MAIVRPWTESTGARHDAHRGHEVFAALVAFGVRSAWPGAYARLSARSLWPLLLVPTAFDWLENLVGLGLILHQDGDRRVLVVALVAMKLAKLAGLAVLWLVTASVLLSAGTGVAWRSMRERRSRLDH